MDRSFWQDKRVFVTGHTGFKGSWLCLWLQRLGARVSGFSLAPETQPNLFEMASVADGMESHIGDIRQLEGLAEAMAMAQPHIVFHLAAQALIHEGYKRPLETYATNVVGTANLLEAVRKCDSVRGVVAVTSDKCYDNREWDWGYREADRLGGKDPYSSSKACAELVTAAYRDSYFSNGNDGEHQVAVATARSGNVIGGGDWSKDRLIPDLIRSILAGESTPLRRPDAVRPWQHVVEPLRGYLVLAEGLFTDPQEFSSSWNFGPRSDDAQPVRWIAERLVSLWGEEAAWHVDTADFPPEATYLKLDCSKAQNRLGWEPRMDLAQALEWLVEWYRAYQNEADLRQTTLNQLERYQQQFGGE